MFTPVHSTAPLRYGQLRNKKVQTMHGHNKNNLRKF